jgi:hypothetical protein
MPAPAAAIEGFMQFWASGIVLTGVAVIGLCYLLTWGAVVGLSTALASVPDLAAMAYGFHFIIATAVPMVVRVALQRLPDGSPLHDGLLSRLSG